MVFSLRNKNYNILVILLTITFLFSFCLSAFSSDSSFRKGFPAPNFTLSTVDGESFNLEDYKEKQKLLILYFCNNENTDSVCGIEELAKYFEEHIIEEKYQVIMINTRRDLKEEDIVQIKEFWTNKKISFTILLDDQNEVSNLYNIEILPTTIFLDKNLIAKRVYPGLLSKQQNLMFQYLTYFLAAKERGTPQKEKKDDSCNGGVCPPPAGY
ncbi:MAG TPA: hypothetical protein DEG96_02805 [Candidatus Atribacteria bacterium]|nr:hypothetical protein [Candidatus Atribacteria bacterium]